MDVPDHIGIILDGNRRYAKQKGLNSLKGHDTGAKRVEEIIYASLELGVKQLTLFTFSTENFNRLKVEVDYLMNLFKIFFKRLKNDKRIAENGVKIFFAGNKGLFSNDIQELMNEIEDKTIDNPKLVVNFAMGYSGRQEILNAVKKIKENNLEITEENFSDNLYVKDDVDLIIRTSGEKRLSGFLSWQGVYAELIFLDKYWPEFEKQDLIDCIEEFNSRKRRFGK